VIYNLKSQVCWKGFPVINDRREFSSHDLGTKKFGGFVLRNILCLLPFILGAGVLMAIEEPNYSVLEKDDDIEVRQYQSYCVVGLDVEGDFEASGNLAFRPLFSYISGSNSGNSKIDMTAPVGQTASTEGVEIDMAAPVGQTSVVGQEGKQFVYFVLPPNMPCSEAPQPIDKRLRLEQIPEKKVVAINYSGRWTESNYREYLTKLNDWIVKKSYEPLGFPVWARYNSPFSLWFLRRNEILQEVSLESSK
jgi:hypothetical protein